MGSWLINSTPLAPTLSKLQLSGLALYFVQPIQVLCFAPALFLRSKSFQRKDESWHETRHWPGSTTAFQLCVWSRFIPGALKITNCKHLVAMGRPDENWDHWVRGANAWVVWGTPLPELPPEWASCPPGTWTHIDAIFWRDKIMFRVKKKAYNLSPVRSVFLCLYGGLGLGTPIDVSLSVRCAL